MDIILPNKDLILPSSFSPEKDKIWTPKKDLLFRIKKYTDLIVSPFKTFVGTAGWYRLEARNDIDGKRRWLTPEFHNNITNYGLNLLSGNNFGMFNYCQVGSGNSPPANTDTTLQNWMASGSKTSNSNPTNSGAPDYSNSVTLTYTFSSGAVVGNISEIGIGVSNTSGSSLFSRELIRDASGNPTTITLASNETLIVYYKLKTYLPVTDNVYSLTGTIAGSSQSRTITARSMNLILTNNNDYYYGWSAFYNGAPLVFRNIDDGLSKLSTSSALSITGRITDLTGTTPSSTSGSTYVSNSFSFTKQFIWNPSVANQSNKTAALMLGYRAGWGACGPMQFEFDTPIVKASNQTLTLQATITWGRH